MSCFRPTILIAVILFCTQCCRAQDSNYVYRDTAILYADSVEAKAVVKSAQAANSKNDNGDGYVVDTLLRNNDLAVEADSIRGLKNLKPFAYSKNLDSLLYQYQQSQRTSEAPEKNKMSWLERFLLSPFTKYFFWMLAMAFVSFILYKLFFAEGIFQRPFAKANVSALPGGSENLSRGADYVKLIGQAVSQGHYRMAVRYHFLQSLQRLSLKGAIQFSPDKTNHQYAIELSGKKYKSAFGALTLQYEYVWYGGFEIDENTFNGIQHKFTQFNSEL